MPRKNCPFCLHPETRDNPKNREVAYAWTLFGEVCLLIRCAYAGPEVFRAALGRLQAQLATYAPMVERGEAEAVLQELAGPAPPLPGRGSVPKS